MYNALKLASPPASCALGAPSPPATASLFPPAPSRCGNRSSVPRLRGRRSLKAPSPRPGRSPALRAQRAAKHKHRRGNDPAPGRHPQRAHGQPARGTLPGKRCDDAVPQAGFADHAAVWGRSSVETESPPCRKKKAVPMAAKKRAAPKSPPAPQAGSPGTQNAPSQETSAPSDARRALRRHPGGTFSCDPATQLCDPRS